MEIFHLINHYNEHIANIEITIYNKMDSKQKSEGIKFYFSK